MKKKNLDRYFKGFFFVASIVDMILGIMFLFFYKSIFTSFGITLPIYPQYLQMAAGFMVVMGVGYLYVFFDMYKNVDLVKVGLANKFFYVVLCSYWFTVGEANKTFFFLAVIQLVFLCGFAMFLLCACREGKA